MLKCVNKCPNDYYIDNELTTVGVKMCVKLCKNLKPIAYIYNDPGFNKEICVRTCPPEA